MSEENWSEHDRKAKQLSNESFSWEKSDNSSTFTEEEKQKLSMMAPTEEYQPVYKTEKNR